MSAHLWNPVNLGKLELPHRLAMAPMTRDRSTPEGMPTELNAEYYAQRASHALIITEGTQPNADGQGYLLTPGIYSEEHIAGWRKVTDAVHGVGGRIVIQLMHAGRMSHPDNTPHRRQPVAPSPVQPAGTMFTPSGPQEMPVPRELSTEEVAATVEDFRRAAAAAIAAGADGVEIHGANGYLVHQFLATNANQRTDRYGGSVDNRIRFAVEVATAVADEIGAGRTGIRISPGNPFNDIAESDTARAVPGTRTRPRPARPRLPAHRPRRRRRTPAHPPQAVAEHLVLNRAGTDIATRAKDIEDGLADIVTVGVMALANPDLVERVRTGAPLNTPDPATFYGGGEAGYTDYPTLSDGAH